MSLGDKITSFTKEGSPANTVAGGVKDDVIGIPSDIGADKIMDKINEAKVKRVDDFYQDPNKLVDEFFDRKGQTKKEQKKDLKKTKQAVKKATSKPSF